MAAMRGIKSNMGDKIPGLLSPQRSFLELLAACPSFGNRSSNPGVIFRPSAGGWGTMLVVFLGVDTTLHCSVVLHHSSMILN
jgi:hypothetical protein